MKQDDRNGIVENFFERPARVSDPVMWAQPQIYRLGRLLDWVTKMWTIFFDIDGTLIRTGGAGLKAMSRVMSDKCGVDKLPQVTVHGRTDCGIWQDVFAELNMQPPVNLEALIDDYCDELQRALNRNEGTELPGVRPLLRELHGRGDVCCYLLTGNARRAAEIKLAAFGLSEFFVRADSELIGGFGDSTGCRNEVARLALESAHRYSDNFEIERAWVIGDTIRDVECARSIGSKVLAVQTGGDSRQTLLDSQPDLVVSDLSKVDEVLKMLLD